MNPITLIPTPLRAAIGTVCRGTRFTAALLLVLATAATSGAQTHSGNIRGSVLDPTEAVIPGATVTLLDQDRGLERETVSSPVGEYLFSHLVPGLYTLRFEAENFAPYVIEDFEVRVGETVGFSPALTLGAATESIVVSAVAARPVIDTNQTAQASHIDFVSIENLPINRRDYLDLALLLPGVLDTNHMVDDRDNRIVPTPQSGLAIGGGTGRSNAFMLDGLSNTYDTGSPRSSISQEAVYEFQVNRNTFSAELGGAPGGAINIVTKGGTSQLRGSLFGVLRNRRFQARNFFDPDKSAYTRSQSGGSIGGPIGNDRTFFYGAYERLDRHESVFVPLLQDDAFLHELKPSQQALVDTLTAAVPAFRPLIGELSAALTPGSYPHVVSMFERNSGVFPFGEVRQQVLGRIDHTLRPGHDLFWRFNWSNQDSENTQFGSLVALSRGRDTSVNDWALAFGDTLTIGSRWISETRIGVVYNDSIVAPTDPHGPSVDINGFGLFGRDFILPTRVVDRGGQVRQNFTRISGPHTYKFGLDLSRNRLAVDAKTFFAGRFIFGEAVPLSSVIDSAVGPGLADQLKGLLTLGGAGHLAAAVDEPISSLQAYALGLPIIYQQGFGDPIWIGWKNRYDFFAEASWRLTPDFTLTLGGRHEFEVKTRFPTDKNNFAPRLGFAWSPDGQTVVRGGFGIYYARIEGHITYINDLLGDSPQIFQVFVPLSGLEGIDSALTGQRLTSAEIYQTALSRGVLGTRTITPQDLAIHGIDPGPGLPLRVQFRVSPDTVNPYSQQGSLEIQREIAGYALSVGYNLNLGVHLIRPLDANVYLAGTDAAGRPIPGFRNPLLLQDNIYGSWGNSSYHALIVQFQKRFFDGFTVSAHHTWSKTMDENTDYNSSFQPHVQWDAKAERALSSFHRGHSFVAHTVMDLPWRSSDGGGGFAHALVRDFTLSAILNARSGAPFNLNAGFDNLGDRHTDTHRPLGVGRNTGVGPDYYSVDLRLNRQFPFGEGRSLELIAEAFNLFNRTNFRTVNSTVGELTLEELPSTRPHGRVGPVTEPFSFTSAFDPRQFQFSLRLNL